MGNLRVLYLSYNGMTDPLGQSQVIAYLKRLATQGIEIDIISFEKPEVFESRKELILREIENAELHWHPLPYHKKPPVLSGFRDISAGFKKAKSLFRSKKFHVIHCRGYLMSKLGRKLSKSFSCPFIFDMRGWWPDEKKESGAWNSPLYKPIFRYFKKLEKRFFEDSAKTVSLTYVGREEIVNNRWKDEKDVGVIPTCVDFEKFPPFDPQTREKGREALKIPQEAPVLLYSGSVGGNYPPKLFKICFKEFRKKHPDAYLFILSKTDPQEVRQLLCGEEIPEDKIRVKGVRYDQVSENLMVGDLGLILYADTYSLIGRSPTKLGEYWASGLPVWSFENIGDLKHIVSKYPQSGTLAKDFGNAAIKNSLDKSFAFASREKLREYAMDYYHIDKGVAFYRELYHSIHKA